MRAETERLVEEIGKSLALLRRRLGWETAEHRLEELNAMTEDPELWNDPARAQKLMRDRQTLADALDGYKALERELADQRELIELGEAEGDEAVVADAELMAGHAISSRLRLNPEFFPDVLDAADV